MTTKMEFTDASREVFVEIRDGNELFARTRMPYMSAIVFRYSWEGSHMDSDRTCEIVSI